MTEKRCYTVKELQEILGVSRPSVYELLKKNEFRSYVIGGKHIISKRSYLLAALFNAPSTIDGYYQAEVQHDMPELAFRR